MLFVKGGGGFRVFFHFPPLGDLTFNSQSHIVVSDRGGRRPARRPIVSGQEVLVVIVHIGEVILSAAVSAQRRPIRQLLDVVQAASDAAVAVGVEGVKVDGRPADDAAVQLGRVQDVPYSATQLMEKLGLKSRANFRKLYLVPALEKNLIAMGIPDKPTTRKQTYIRK